MWERRTDRATPRLPTRTYLCRQCGRRTARDGKRVRIGVGSRPSVESGVFVSAWRSFVPSLYGTTRPRLQRKKKAPSTQEEGAFLEETRPASTLDHRFKPTYMHQRTSHLTGSIDFHCVRLPSPCPAPTQATLPRPMDPCCHARNPGIVLASVHPLPSLSSPTNPALRNGSRAPARPPEPVRRRGQGC